MLKLDGTKGNLELLFVRSDVHSKGIGYAAWYEVARMYPQIKIWETCTPYFEKRNIHFYVNKCGVQIVEFFNEKYPDSYEKDSETGEGLDGMLRFQKVVSERL